MSWIEEVTGLKLKIQTGDGKEYQPLYKSPRFTENYNAVGIEFNDIKGVFVPRGEVGKATFPIELYFQGENHLDIMKEFRESSKDTRNWIVLHPYYEQIVCQPVSLTFDNSLDNVTKITGELWETIEKSNPTKIRDIDREVQESIKALLDNIAKEFEPENLENINSATNAVGETGLRAAVSDIDLGNMQQAIANVDAALNTIGTDPIRYMTQVADIVRAPAQFYDTAKNRLRVVRENFDNLTQSLNGLNNLPDKIYTEASAAFAVVAATECITVTNGTIRLKQEDEVGDDGTNPKPELEDDFKTRRDVLEFQESLNTIYNDYITALGVMQSDEDNKPDSYYPSHDLVIATKIQLRAISGSLFSIASNAKQERTYTLKQPKGILPLVNELYGNRKSETVLEFRNANALGMAETMLIPAGRKVVYYV